MTRLRRILFRVVVTALAVVIGCAIGAPFLTVDQYARRLQGSLEHALGRHVELGEVRFGLFGGPHFSVDSVTIFEDPAIGNEPIAIVQKDSGGLEVAPSLWSLLGGRFVIASIRLEGASINLAKSQPGGPEVLPTSTPGPAPADSPARWNFEALVHPSVMRTAPAIHVRNSRINFKFGDTKSGFYLTDTDLDISPPATRAGGWKLYCSAKTARTDRSALGLGSFTLRGRWWVAPERVDLNLEMDRTSIGELTALLRGQAAGLHGMVSARLHLAGPINGIGIQGRMQIEDVHRWDVLPPYGQGWPIDVRGRLDLLSQQVELQSWSAANATPPLSVRLRVTDYLARPHWAVAVNWNRFAVEPLMELATHMGAQFPPGLKLSGSMDGAIGYSGEGHFQGQLGFHDTVLTIPDSPPVRFEQAYVIVDGAHARLSPAVVWADDREQARIEADYAIGAGTMDLTISTEGMRVASLRAQVGLARVPWLEQVTSGEWNGELHYHRDADTARWTGRLTLHDANIPVPGLAHPLELSSAHAEIDGARVILEQIDAQAGRVAFTGEYRYEPEAPRPHHVRLRFEEVDAADLEKELLPTLHRSSGLIARALGRTKLPEWMSQRSVEGSVQIGTLLLGGERLQNVRARLLWDVTRVEFDNLQARLDHATIGGKLAVNLRAARPSYRWTGKVKGWDWQSGKVDAEGTLETAGTGEELLGNLKSDVAFTASALDFGTTPPWRTVSGSCALAWSPRLHLTGLSLRMEDETYVGKGAMQDDGRMLILLSNGARELRMSGPPAKLRLEDAVR